MSSRILAILMVLFANVAFADNDYDRCNVKKLGWHFYCDRELEEEEEKEPQKKEQAKPATAAKSPEDYIAERDAIRHELEWKQARAVLYPTQENILDYIRTQRDMAMQPATTMAMNWRKAVWTNPDVDYTLKHPVNTLGKQANLDTLRSKKKAVIKNINERYGIFYLYMSTCVYCKKYTPVLQAFAKKHDLIVKAISVDGPISPEWPNSVHNPKFIEKLGMANKPVPATILFDKKNKSVIPVGFGLMAMDELETRIYEMTKEEGDDY